MKDENSAFSGGARHDPAKVVARDLRMHFEAYRRVIDATLRHWDIPAEDVVWCYRGNYDATVSFRMRAMRAQMRKGDGHIARITRDGAVWLNGWQPPDQGDDTTVLGAV
ncbi:MAG: hypothetical protein A2Y38_09155 [Spirochaetes bacterium GWB1_59_5]|nr:MAG: hypothetical protein A2Y38_09155 [Spirochaetes bacterium GWB1_59_5]